LPWLESLTPAARAQVPRKAQRFVAIYSPNGVPEFWTPPPVGVGDSWQLSSVLEPVRAVRTAGPRCTIHDFGFALPSASADIVHNAGCRGMLRAMTAEQEPDFKQRHLQDVQALLDADTTKLDIGVLVATTENE